MKSTLFLMVLALGLSAQAALLTFDQGAKQLEGVNLSSVASINDAQGKPSDIKLDLLGAGLRSKTVLFVAAKVYVMQLFSDSKATFSRDQNALTSLAGAKTLNDLWNAKQRLAHMQIFYECSVREVDDRHGHFVTHLA